MTTIKHRLETAERAIDENQFPAEAEAARLRLLKAHVLCRPGAEADRETLNRHLRNVGREPRNDELDLLSGTHEKSLARLR